MKLRKRKKQFAWGFYVLRSYRHPIYGRVRTGEVGMCRKIRKTTGYYV